MHEKNLAHLDLSKTFLNGHSLVIIQRSKTPRAIIDLQ